MQPYSHPHHSFYGGGREDNAWSTRQDQHGASGRLSSSSGSGGHQENLGVSGRTQQESDREALLQKIANLEKQVSTQQDTIFDLHANVATIQAESQYYVTQATQEAHSKVREMEESLQRHKEEAQVATAKWASAIRERASAGSGGGVGSGASGSGVKSGGGFGALVSPRGHGNTGSCTPATASKTPSKETLLHAKHHQKQTSSSLHHGSTRKVSHSPLNTHDMSTPAPPEKAASKREATFYEEPPLKVIKMNTKQPHPISNPNVPQRKLNPNAQHSDSASCPHPIDHIPQRLLSIHQHLTKQGLIHHAAASDNNKTHMFEYGGGLNLVDAERLQTMLQTMVDLSCSNCKEGENTNAVDCARRQAMEAFVLELISMLHETYKSGVPPAARKGEHNSSIITPEDGGKSASTKTSSHTKDSASDGSKCSHVTEKPAEPQEKVNSKDRNHSGKPVTSSPTTEKTTSNTQDFVRLNCILHLLRMLNQTLHLSQHARSYFVRVCMDATCASKHSVEHLRQEEKGVMRRTRRMAKRWLVSSCVASQGKRKRQRQSRLEWNPHGGNGTDGSGGGASSSPEKILMHASQQLLRKSVDSRKVCTVSSFAYDTTRKKKNAEKNSGILHDSTSFEFVSHLCSLLFCEKSVENGQHPSSNSPTKQEISHLHHKTVRDNSRRTQVRRNITSNKNNKTRTKPGRLSVDDSESQEDDETYHEGRFIAMARIKVKKECLVTFTLLLQAMAATTTTTTIGTPCNERVSRNGVRRFVLCLLFGSSPSGFVLDNKDAGSCLNNCDEADKAKEGQNNKSVGKLQVQDASNTSHCFLAWHTSLVHQDPSTLSTTLDQIAKRNQGPQERNGRSTKAPHDVYNHIMLTVMQMDLKRCVIQWMTHAFSVLRFCGGFHHDSDSRIVPTGHGPSSNKENNVTAIHDWTIPTMSSIEKMISSIQYDLSSVMRLLRTLNTRNTKIVPSTNASLGDGAPAHNNSLERAALRLVHANVELLLSCSQSCDQEIVIPWMFGLRSQAGKEAHNEQGIKQATKKSNKAIFTHVLMDVLDMTMSFLFDEQNDLTSQMGFSSYDPLTGNCGSSCQYWYNSTWQSLLQNIFLLYKHMLTYVAKQRQRHIQRQQQQQQQQTNLHHDGIQPHPSALTFSNLIGVDHTERLRSFAHGLATNQNDDKKDSHDLQEGCAKKETMQGVREIALLVLQEMSLDEHDQGG